MDIEAIYEKLDNVLGGEIELRDDMTFIEAIQYMENVKERIITIVDLLKKAHTISNSNGIQTNFTLSELLDESETDEERNGKKYKGKGKGKEKESKKDEEK